MLRTTTLLTLIAAITLCGGCARSSGKRTQDAPVPEDWQLIAFNGISFALPPGLEETPVQATTGVLRQFEGLQLQVNVHAGDYAGSLREFETASGSFEWLEIQGRRARGTSVILDGRAFDGIYLPEPGAGLEPLSILVISLNPQARQQGMLVLQSLRFD